MTTKPQLFSFDEGPHDEPSLRERALAAMEKAGPRGATYDEAYALAYPGKAHGHSKVDSFRVMMRKLREDGIVMDSGRERMNRDRSRAQAVWVLGDDREVVEKHRRAKLRKFPTEWLLDELQQREQGS